MEVPPGGASSSSETLGATSCWRSRPLELCLQRERGCRVVTSPRCALLTQRSHFHVNHGKSPCDCLIGSFQHRLRAPAPRLGVPTRPHSTSSGNGHPSPIPLFQML